MEWFLMAAVTYWDTAIAAIVSSKSSTALGTIPVLSFIIACTMTPDVDKRYRMESCFDDVNTGEATIAFSIVTGFIFGIGAAGSTTVQYLVTTNWKFVLLMMLISVVCLSLLQVGTMRNRARNWWSSQDQAALDWNKKVTRRNFRAALGGARMLGYSLYESQYNRHADDVSSRDVIVNCASFRYLFTCMLVKMTWFGLLMLMYPLAAWLLLVAHVTSVLLDARSVSDPQKQFDNLVK